jgi:hypothetical protein
VGKPTGGAYNRWVGTSRTPLARRDCARVVFGGIGLGTHATGWVCSRTHRGGVGVELAPAAAGARTKDDVFFEVAAVVEEVEA